MTLTPIFDVRVANPPNTKLIGLQVHNDGAAGKGVPMGWSYDSHLMTRTLWLTLVPKTGLQVHNNGADGKGMWPMGWEEFQSRANASAAVGPGTNGAIIEARDVTPFSLHFARFPLFCVLVHSGRLRYRPWEASLRSTIVPSVV